MRPTRTASRLCFSHRSDQKPGYRPVPVRIFWPGLEVCFTFLFRRFVYRFVYCIANLVHPQILGVWWSCDWPMSGPFPTPPPMPGKSALGTSLEINDAERKPNRRNISTKYFPCHCIPSKGRSSGWIATFPYALATANVAISVPRHRARMPSITASTETYCTVKGGLGLPSFTLCPAGEERSRMRRHLHG